MGNLFDDAFLYAIRFNIMEHPVLLVHPPELDRLVEVVVNFLQVDQHHVVAENEVTEVLEGLDPRVVRPDQQQQQLTQALQKKIHWQV